jgi:DNA replicative helicase MCM subunit Mcm2 (Cdc46/Mcm family)
MTKPAAIHSMANLRAGINILLYGDNGVGKTPIIGTSPKCLILNSDPPESVLSAKIAGSNADVWNFSDWSDAEESYEYLRHEPNHGYEWVWLDSITGMQFVGLDGIMEDLVAVKPHRDRFVPDKHEYLQNMNRLSTWVRDMSALPINFGLTSHPFRWRPDTEEEEIVWPWVQGKDMPAKICGFMNVIAYVRIGKVKGKDDPQQLMYTGKLPRYYARDRFSALPSPLVNPTIPRIQSVIESKVGGSVRQVIRPIKKANKAKVIKTLGPKVPMKRRV